MYLYTLYVHIEAFLFKKSLDDKETYLTIDQSNE